MFDTLTDRLDGIFKRLRSRGKLHPKQVDGALAEMRVALLEADVSAEVADDLLARVRDRALSEEVMKSLTPAQQVVKVVRDELQSTMGGTQVAFTLPSVRPAVVMMAGVQGSGKTTACAKIALHLKSKGKRPLLVAADLWRPAAVEQLFTLGREIGVDVVSDGKDAVKVAKGGVKHAGREGHDVVIVDTAGRLHVDEDMMREARRVKEAIDPHHVVMACDAMTGQDAVIQARAFMREVDTSGFVLTKIDGDARGGAALSITAVTRKPVFFAGTGERPEDLEPFYPDRMASRIMGMGDVPVPDRQGAGEPRSGAGGRDRREDALGQVHARGLLVQMQALRKLGPLQDLLAMLPGVPGGKNALKDLEVNEGQLGRAQAIIQSMTREERQNPAIIGGSRRSRIARGSGVTTAEVNALLKEFEQARKMMKSMLGGKGLPRLPGMPNLPGVG
jgi:signal recognition particle subunit SRP54